MAGYIVQSGNYRFEELGLVHVNVKTTAKRVIARWKGGGVVVTAPKNIAYDELLDILRRLVPRLEEVKPAPLYCLDETIDLGEIRVDIVSQSYAPDRMIAEFNRPGGVIRVGTGWNMEEAHTMKTISKFLCRMAQSVAPDVLLPRARTLAQENGCAPMGWKISNGHRTLGTCDSKGVIALSYALLFYPTHLRDYVICHELAHLSEFNHSARFHAICDTYCDGRESLLEAELKSFRPKFVK